MTRKIKNIISKMLFGGFLSIVAIGTFCLGEGMINAAAATAEPSDYALAYREYEIENYVPSMMVKDPSGNVVATENGVFTPLREGDYTIRDGGTMKIVRVFATVPQTSYTYEFPLKTEYRTGEIIELPRAEVVSAVSNEIAYDIFVEYDGELIDVLSDSNQRTYQFNKAGGYALTYTYEDIFGYISTSTNYCDVVDMPVIAYDAPKALSLGKTVSVDTIFAYNGADRVEADLEIIAPSGKKVDLSIGSFVAEEFGMYLYNVSAEIGGDVVTAQYEVPCDIYTNDLFDATTLAKEPIAGKELPAICSQKGNGVLLEASATGAKFTFNNVIDLNNITRDINLLSFFPYVSGEIGHVEDLQIILTDIYDKDNSVGIQFKCSPFHDNLTYVSAFHNGRHYAFDNENWVLTGVNGPVKIGDQYFFAGIMRNHYSMQMKSPDSLNVYSFTMDYPQRQMVLDLTSEREGRYTLMDFDNPIWCGGAEYVWNGFTTGEVYMTIHFGTIVGKSASIIVTEVAGQSVSGTSIKDTTAPSIVLGLDKRYQESMPYGLVGKEYELPNVRANDIVSGSIETEVAIFLEGTQIAYNGGEFVPQKAGTYTVVYTATDLKGNVSEKRLVFEVYEEAPMISVNMLKHELPITGKYFKIPDIVVNGASGKTEVVTEVVYNNLVVLPDEAGKIYIDKVGNIRLNVFVTDWLGQEIQQALDIPVSTEEMRILVEERYSVVQAGRTLKFADALVYDFNDKGDNEVAQKILVNGQELNGNTYTVTENDEILEVNYQVSCAGKTAEYNYSIVVIKSLKNIFTTDGTYTVAGKYQDEVHFQFTQDGEFALVNPVSHNYLKLNLSTPVYAFDYMDVYFTDSANPDVSVFLRFTEYSRTQVRMQLNGKGDYYLLSGSLSAGVPFTFFYESERLVFKQAIDEKVIFQIKECKNGDVFKGFESEAVSVRVLVKGVQGNSTVRLCGISNETFVTYLLTGKDSVQPVISVPVDKETIQGEYGIPYEVKPTKAYDVIQGIFDVRVTVIAPNGNMLCENKILQENFVFMTDCYGTYSIIYETFDNAYIGKSTKTVFLQIRDKVAPTISLRSAWTLTEAMLGDTMTITGATATDNVDTDIEIKIFVYDPQYRNTIVKEGDVYRFTYKGKYRVVYLATDSAGNQTREIYYIEVK